MKPITHNMEDWTPQPYPSLTEKIAASDSLIPKSAEEAIKYVTSVSSLDDYFCLEVAMRRYRRGESTIVKSTDLQLEDQSQILGTMREMYPTWLMLQTPGYSNYILAIDQVNDGVLFLNNRNRGIMRLNVCGDPDWCDRIMAELLTHFQEVSSFVEWVYSSDGDSVRIPLNVDHLPTESMYPWLNGRTLKDYYKSFMESSANILLLLGVPGSGKTTFIRGLLHETKTSATVTYDPGILTKDSFFAQFLESPDINAIVLEDADNFMRSRADGNDMMHRFLNLGDGLVSSTRKKLIFSTNLASLHDVDEALTRPGRCFDMVEFSDLTSKQAKVVAKEFGVKFDPERSKKYTLAEVLCNTKFSGDSSGSSDDRSRSNFGFCPQ